MSTVTIYKVTCTKAESVYEGMEPFETVGTRFQLDPWGENTTNYEGSDDGGHLYALPIGYTTGIAARGTREIYDADGNHCSIFHYGEAPAIRTANGIEPLVRL